MNVGGNSAFNLNGTQLTVGGNVVINGNGAGFLTLANDGGVMRWGASADVILARDAANTLALRNGTNAQAFRVYNTFTDASNYERGFFQWSSNILRIGAENAGTGSSRAVEIFAAGAVALRAATDGSLSGGSFSSADSGFLDVYTSNTAALAGTAASAKIRLKGSTIGSPYISISSDGYFGFAGGTSTIFNAPDAGLARSAGGVVVVTDASTGGGSLEFREQTAPAAPAANGVRIYAEDNGSGKTRLMALFATGAAQQIAIEP
jgi:hypothetical protein